MLRKKNLCSQGKLLTATGTFFFLLLEKGQNDLSNFKHDFLIALLMQETFGCFFKNYSRELQQDR